MFAFILFILATTLGGIDTAHATETVEAPTHAVSVVSIGNDGALTAYVG